MNIFILDEDIQENVKCYVDKWVVKMITEHNQILASVHYMTNSDYTPQYKLTHKNHPCSVWARESIENYRYLIKLNHALCEEYTYRYGKIHAGEKVNSDLSLNEPKIESKGFTKFALAMPEKYHSDNAVDSYRNYMIGEKQHLFNWKKRNIPEWIISK